MFVCVCVCVKVGLSTEGIERWVLTKKKKKKTEKNPTIIEFKQSWN